MTTRLDLHDLVHQLTNWHTHREPFEYHLEHGATSTRYATNHLTQQPPLIAQVWGSVTPASQGGEVGAATPTSKPTANLDAIDCAADIDRQAARWVRDLGEDDPLDTIGCIRRLHGLTASVERCARAGARRTEAGRVDCCAWHAIEVDVRSWWTRARVLTGWDTAARRLHGTCPLCGTRDAVRVRFSAGVATCTSCREWWDEETIGMLAEHIRLEGEAERFAPAPPPVACRELDDEGAIARMMLCPDCGSRRCVKAQDQVVKPLSRRRAVG